ncbi:hypothetical protein [Bacillus sp. CH30_1T]|nr:hypothetical protein [Bacillus sp. CH30_1T]
MMNIDGNVVIQKLGNRISQLEIELAFKESQLEELMKQLNEKEQDGAE